MAKKKSKASTVAKPEREKISANLRHIYENADGSLPDMKTFERGSRHWLIRSLIKIFIFIGCVALGVVIWQGFIQPRWQFSDESVAVAIDAPPAAAAGSDITYTIRYRNPGNSPLASAALELHYPTGFTFKSASQPGLSGSNTRWEIGSMPERTSGVLSVTGSLNGDYNTVAVISAILSYTPSNFNSLFEKVGTATTVLSNPALNLAINIVSSTSSNAPAALSIDLNPTTPITHPIIVALDVPPHFIFQSAHPKVTQDGILRWTLSSLSQEQTIEVQGAFSADAVDGETFSVQVLSGPAGGISQSYTLATATTSMVIARAPLQVSLLVNGKQTPPSFAPGDTISASVVVQNTSNQTIEHALASLVIVAPSYKQKSLLQWAQLGDKLNGTVKGEQVDPNSRRGIITWTEKEAPALAKLAPGQSITFDITLPIKNGKDTSLVNFASNAISLFATLGAPSLPAAIQSNPINFSVHSDVDLEARVNSSDTTKNVTWILTNSFHDLKDVRVEADLYGDFSWDAGKLSVPAGKASFDSAGKRLVWAIDTLPTSLDTAALQFSLNFSKLNSTQTELSSRIKVNATDAETGEKIMLTLDPMKME